MKQQNNITVPQVSSVTNKKTISISLNLKNLLIILIVIILIALSFGAGYWLSSHQNHTSNNRSFRVSSSFVRRRYGFLGVVSAISATSITVSNSQTGVTKTFNITSSTIITENGQTISSNKIANGDTVIIKTLKTQTSNALRIIVNPAYKNFSQ